MKCRHYASVILSVCEMDKSVKRLGVPSVFIVAIPDLRKKERAKTAQRGKKKKISK